MQKEHEFKKIYHSVLGNKTDTRLHGLLKCYAMH